MVLFHQRAGEMAQSRKRRVAFIQRLDVPFECADLLEGDRIDERVLRAEILEDVGGRHAERRGDIGNRHRIETTFAEKLFCLGENVPPRFLGGTARPAPDRTVTLPVGLSRLFDRLRGRDPVVAYQAWLLKFGRITEGRVVDAQRDEGGVTVYYYYYRANVKYETSQHLSPTQTEHWDKYVPGASVTVRFDPKRPGRSALQ